MDLAGHPGVRAFLPRLLQGLPRAWHDAIFRPPTPLRRPDDIFLTLKDVYSRAVQRDVSTLKSLDFYLLSPHKTFLHIQTDCDLDDRMIPGGTVFWGPPTGKRPFFTCIITTSTSTLRTFSINISMAKLPLVSRCFVLGCRTAPCAHAADRRPRNYDIFF